MRTVHEKGNDDEESVGRSLGDWNVVQNNGSCSPLSLSDKCLFFDLRGYIHKYFSTVQARLYQIFCAMNLPLLVPSSCPISTLIRTPSFTLLHLGARAAQLVPHIHFHIIPRPPSDSAPSAGKSSWVMFGRGPRDELDDDEGRVLTKEMRAELAKEVKRVWETEGVDLDADIETKNMGKL